MMILFRVAILLSLISFITPDQANATIGLEAVYGEDSRVFIDDYKDSHIQWISLSTAAMVNAKRISTGEFKNFSIIQGQSIEKEYELCPDEKFAKAFTAAECSGFLVGPDLLVTAGHCITNKWSCDHNKFIFEFNQMMTFSKSEDEIFVPNEHIYGCKEIVNRTYQPSTTQNDFSLIKLDRPVLNRKPLKFRTSGKIDNNAELVAIGHPLGMKTIAVEGKVFENKNPFFFNTSLDTFMGNSGGAVINKKTGLVEGLLVRGEADFVLDEFQDCFRPKICLNDGTDCMKEDVIRITVIPELVPGMTPPDDEPVVEPEPIIVNDNTNDDDNDDDDDDDWLDFFNQ